MFFFCAPVFLVPAGCQSLPPSSEQQNLPAHLSAYEEHPAVAEQRALRRAAQGRAQDSALIDEIEWRVGGLSADSFGTGEGFELLARLPFRNPWELQALGESADAVARASDAEAFASALRAEEVRCLAAVDHLAAEADRLQTEQHLVLRRVIESWHQRQADALQVDALDTLRFSLQGELQHIDLPPPSPPPHNLLPSDTLTPRIPSKSLDTSTSTILSLLRAHHPALVAPREAAEARQHQARAAEAEQTPWLKFLDLGWQSLDGPERIEARVAFSFPFGAEAGADEARYTAEAAALQAQSEAILLDLHAQAAAALAAIDHFERLDSALRAAEARAEAAQADLLRLTHDNQGDPRRAAQILDDILTLRRRVLSARRAAAVARCALHAASAVELSAWPRLP